MIIYVLFVDEWVILAATVPKQSGMTVMSLATLHRTVPTRFLHQEHVTTKTDVIQGIYTPHPKRWFTLHTLWSQTGETFQPITILLP